MLDGRQRGINYMALRGTIGTRRTGTNKLHQNPANDLNTTMIPDARTWVENWRNPEKKNARKRGDYLSPFRSGHPSVMAPGKSIGPRSRSRPRLSRRPHSALSRIRVGPALGGEVPPVTRSEVGAESGRGMATWRVGCGLLSYEVCANFSVLFGEGGWCGWRSGNGTWIGGSPHFMSYLVAP